MNKIIVNFLILVSCYSAFSVICTAQNQNSSAIVKIISGSFGENRIFQRSLAGSGVIIDPRGIIVTSRDVVFPKNSKKEFPEIWAGVLNSKRVNLRPNQAYRLRLMSYDENIAILKIEGNLNQIFPTLQFGETGNLRYGQDLRAVGFMQANGTSLSNAEVSFLDYDDNQDLLKIEGEFLNGISGGAIVDKTGKLIGITVSTRASDFVPFFNQNGEEVGKITIESVGLVVPVEAVQEFLRSVPNLRGFTITSDLRKSIAIEGAVTDKKTNEPIQRATIGILISNMNSKQFIEEDELLAYARTDERGAFKLNRKLKPGTYSVKVVHPDYKTEYKTIQIPTASGRLIFELTKESRIIIK
jgi:S1-C subfamily serine protease